MSEPSTALQGVYDSTVSHDGASRRSFEYIKRLTEPLIALGLLIIVSPLLIVCAIIVKCSSPGPMVFRQVRLGRNGRPFVMYKLRTMREDSETDTGAVWASQDDPRVVSSCRWMRQSHVDELPQLVNVLRGEMSLVGPRPERPEIIQDLTKVYPNYYRRLDVRPGITGLAQIRNGYDSSIEGVRHKLEADLEYIAHRNWGLEWRILMVTLTKFYDKGAH